MNILIADQGFTDLRDMENKLKEHYHLQFVSQLDQAQEIIEFGGLAGIVIRYELLPGNCAIKHDVRSPEDLAVRAKLLYPNSVVVMMTRNKDSVKFGNERLEGHGIPLFYRMEDEKVTEYLIKTIGTESK